MSHRLASARAPAPCPRLAPHRTAPLNPHRSRAWEGFSALGLDDMAAVMTAARRAAPSSNSCANARPRLTLRATSDPRINGSICARAHAALTPFSLQKRAKAAAAAGRTRATPAIGDGDARCLSDVGEGRERGATEQGKSAALSSSEIARWAERRRVRRADLPLMSTMAVRLAGTTSLRRFFFFFFAATHDDDDSSVESPAHACYTTITHRRGVWPE
ncbi:hypothetical protein BKA80DRAFT_67914 [Phyllosticta citrichinensis]